MLMLIISGSSGETEAFLPFAEVVVVDLPRDEVTDLWSKCLAPELALVLRAASITRSRSVIGFVISSLLDFLSFFSFFSFLSFFSFFIAAVRGESGFASRGDRLPEHIGCWLKLLCLQH